MTAIQKKADNPIAHRTQEDIEELGRELDAIRVKGRNQALKIYQLLARATELAPEQEVVVANYAEGLAHWRAREFDRAATSFGRSAESDRPSSLFRTRARELAENPPGQDWDPIRTLQEK